MVEQQSVSVETLKAIADAFNAHDLDTIMEFFADDCSLDLPRGPQPWGQRFTGKARRARGPGRTLQRPPGCALQRCSTLGEWQYGRVRVAADRHGG